MKKSTKNRSAKFLHPLPFTLYPHEAGQALLILIMVIAVVITVALAATFTSRTDTQISRLSEESQKALAAAEAGIEKALEKYPDGGSFDIETEPDLQSLKDAGFTGTVTIANAGSSTEFTSPVVRKDEQYTFYLSKYNKYNPNTDSGNDFDPSPAQDITFCLQGGSPAPAAEVTIVKSDNSLNRVVIDPDNSSNRISSASFPSSGCPSSDTSFVHQYRINPSLTPANSKLMLVRMLFADSRFYVKGNASFPSQGVLIRSEAKSQLGANKVIELFQSYPQIPSDFFVTQF